VAANGIEAMLWNTKTSGVDYFTVTPGLSGTPPQIAVAGSTANQNFNLYANGTGSVDIPSASVGIGTTTPAANLDVNGAMYSRRHALTCASSLTVNWALGNVQSLLLNCNVTTLTFTGGQDGGRYVLIVTQASSGGPYTITWSNIGTAAGDVRFPGGSGGSAPTLTTTAGRTDYIGFLYNVNAVTTTALYDAVSLSQNY
jgi:hypothetical protein